MGRTMYEVSNIARGNVKRRSHEQLIFLNVAADQAPDAPAVTDKDDHANQCRLSVDPVAGIEEAAAGSSRARVLDIARQAIDQRIAASTTRAT